MRRWTIAVSFAVVVAFAGCGEPSSSSNTDAGAVVDTTADAETGTDAVADTESVADAESTADTVADTDSAIDTGPVCVNTCAPAATSCKNNQPSICADDTGDGCVAWVLLDKCADDERCLDGGCKPISCGEGTIWKGDKCVPISCGPGLVLKFGMCVPIPCGKGTVLKDGKCVPACVGACIVGTSRCVDGVPELCTAKQDGPCGGWVKQKGCAADAFCYDGLCRKHRSIAPESYPWSGQVYLNSVAADGDGKTLYAGGDWAGVIVSTDDGKTWKPRNNGFWQGGDHAVSSIATDPTKAGRVTVLQGRYPTTTSRLYHSEDSGKNWRRLQVPTCAYAHSGNRASGRVMAWTTVANAPELIVAMPGCGLLVARPPTQNAAGDGEWTFSKAPGLTGFFFAAASAANGNVYAAARTNPATGAGGGLWRRKKGETTWSKVVAGNFSTVAAVKDGTVYLGGWDGLWKLAAGKDKPERLLDNVGCPKPNNAWKNKTPRPKVTAIWAEDSNVIFGSGRHGGWGGCQSPLQRSGVFRSTNGGVTFLPQKTATADKAWASNWFEPNNAGFFVGAFARSKVGTLFVAAPVGVWRSTDLGKSLTRIQHGVPGATTAVRVSRFLDGKGKAHVVAGVFGRDLGIWDQQGKPVSLLKLPMAKPDDRKFATTVRALLPLPANKPKRFVAAIDSAYWNQHKKNHGLVIARNTLDAGDWQVLFKPGPFINTLSADPNDAKRLGLVCRSGTNDKGKPVGGVWMTVDGGKTWQRRTGGLAKKVEHNNFLRTTTPVTLEIRGERAYLSMFRDGAWRSSNGGKSWAEMPVLTRQGGKIVKYKANQTERLELAAHPKDGKKLWILVNRYTGSWLSYSTDGGLNFDVIDGPYPGSRLWMVSADRTGAHLLTAAIPHGSLVYPGGGPGMWRFDTAKRTWLPVDIDAPEGQLTNSIAPDWTTDNTFLIGSNGTPVLRYTFE